MADIRLRITGDSSSATAAMRDMGGAAGEMGSEVDESTESLQEQAEAAAEAGDEQEDLSVKMRDVAKAAKDIVKFVGDSVKEYLKAADANKELAKVAKDLEDAQIGVKKSVGEATLEIAKQAQLAEAAKGALGVLQTLLHGATDEEVQREQRMNAALTAQTQLRLAQADLDVARVSKIKADIQAATDAVDAAEIKLREVQVSQGLDVSLADSAAATAKQRELAAQKAATAKAAADAARAAENEQTQIVLDAANARLDVQKKAAAESAKLLAQYAAAAVEAEQKDQDAITKVEMDALEARQKAVADAEEESIKASVKQGEQVIAQSKREIASTSQQWANLGTTIGSSFVSAFTSILDTMLQGGPNDPTKTIVAVLDVVFQAAGAIIGYATGNPALGQAIGALGSLGTHAIAGAASKKQGASSLTAHNGSWVGLPKYHEGGWVGGAGEVVALLKQGERVMSEREVNQMGGPAAVDKAAAGKGDTNVFVTAIDSKSATEGFLGALGKAQRRAQISGYGSLAVAR